MSKWSNLYEKEILSAPSIDDFITKKLATKKKIIKLINKYAFTKKIMEVGAGTGVLALYISSLNNNKVDALDKDHDMISLSKKYFLSKFKNSAPKLLQHLNHLFLMKMNTITLIKQQKTHKEKILFKSKKLQ